MVVFSGSKITKSNNIQPLYENNVLAFSVSLNVSWSWYSKKDGIVIWTFTNRSFLQSTVILFRNGYYFGNAYFPIYLQNGVTNWAKKLSPLIDKGVEQNSMPLAILDFGNGNRIVAFIFTLAGGQKWSVLEGGFSEFMPPSNVALFDVNYEHSGQFCIGYDPKQVMDWDEQTNSDMKGYSPNPSTFDTIELSVPSTAPYVKLFKFDFVQNSPCTNQINNMGLENKSSDDLEEIIGSIINRIRSI